MNYYKKWLEASALYFGVKEEDILRKGSRTPLINKARKTFYYLCFRDGINLYQLGLDLGRHRTSITSTMYNTNNRDIPAEKAIIAERNNNCIDDVIEYWMDRKDSKSKEIVLTSLIAQKQLINLTHENL